MEIERKWHTESIPFDTDEYSFTEITQGYISRNPVIRIRKIGDKYILTVKGSGKLCREEYELEIDKCSFEELSEKCDGIILKKKRRYIPLDKNGNRLEAGAKGTYTAELDIFEDEYAGLIYIETEFASEKDALSFKAPSWFGHEVTNEKGYSNAELSAGNKKLMSKDIVFF